jgi:hypothetical protein
MRGRERASTLSPDRSRGSPHEGIPRWSMALDVIRREVLAGREACGSDGVRSTYHRHVSDNKWPLPWQSDRVERDPNRVALLIPGYGYSPERPLLHFARAVFMKYAWTTQEVWWPERPPQREGQDLHIWFARLRSFVHTHIGQILQRDTAPRIALAGKSMGAFAAALAADRGFPGIWLTPVLRDSDLAGDLRRSTAPFLLVGSTADPSWDPELARSFGQPFYEAQDANHGMETDDDPVNSAEVLRHATIAMDAFVATL